MHRKRGIRQIITFMNANNFSTDCIILFQKTANFLNYTSGVKCGMRMTLCDVVVYLLTGKCRMKLSVFPFHIIETPYHSRVQDPISIQKDVFISLKLCEQKAFNDQKVPKQHRNSDTEGKCAI